MLNEEIKIKEAKVDTTKDVVKIIDIPDKFDDYRFIDDIAWNKKEVYAFSFRKYFSDSDRVIFVVVPLLEKEICNISYNHPKISNSNNSCGERFAIDATSVPRGNHATYLIYNNVNFDVCYVDDDTYIFSALKMLYKKYCAKYYMIGQGYYLGLYELEFILTEFDLAKKLMSKSHPNPYEIIHIYMTVAYEWGERLSSGYDGKIPDYVILGHDKINIPTDIRPGDIVIFNNDMRSIIYDDHNELSIVIAGFKHSLLETWNIIDGKLRKKDDLPDIDYIVRIDRDGPDSIQSSLTYKTVINYLDKPVG